jgi:hypothetical protein
MLGLVNNSTQPTILYTTEGVGESWDNETQSRRRPLFVNRNRRCRGTIAMRSPPLDSRRPV